jgi:hypothetical protein
MMQYGYRTAVTSGRRDGPIVYRFVPPGLTALLQGFQLRVAVSDKVAPGRYYIGVELTIFALTNGKTF